MRLVVLGAHRLPADETQHARTLAVGAPNVCCMMYDMQRTTIFIPEALEAELRQYARRRQQPIAWVVREAVATYLANNRRFKMPASIGLFASGETDVSERAEELLFADLTPHDDRVRTAAKHRARKLRKRAPAR